MAKLLLILCFIHTTFCKEIQLSTGWNIISGLAGNPTTLLSNYQDIIIIWSNKNGVWSFSTLHSLGDELKKEFNQNISFDPKLPYYLKTSKPIVLSVFPSTLQIDLTPGWNFVSGVSIDVNQIKTLNPNIKEVHTLETSSWISKMYPDISHLNNIKTISTMTDTTGYWIRTSQAIKGFNIGVFDEATFE